MFSTCNLIQVGQILPVTYPTSILPFFFIYRTPLFGKAIPCSVKFSPPQIPFQLERALGPSSCQQDGEISLGLGFHENSFPNLEKKGGWGKGQIRIFSPPLRPSWSAEEMLSVRAEICDYKAPSHRQEAEQGAKKPASLMTT